MQFIKLHIELTEVKVPNTRTILVPADFTMLQLHNCIQALYGLGNYHLRDFCRNVRGGNRIFVQTKSEIDELESGFGFAPDAEYLEAEKTTISDFFNKENDKAVYSYDYGANNERIVTYKGTSEKDGKYPVCLESKGHLILEDEPSWMSEEWNEIYEKNDKKAFEKKQEEFDAFYDWENFKEIMSDLYENSGCETLTQEMSSYEDEMDD